MQKAIRVALVILPLVARPALAAESDQSTTHRVVKVVVGAGAIAVGAAIAAKSSQTTTVTSPLGSSETSTFSTTQLATGLAIAGVGGFVLWDGLRHPEPSKPSSSIRIAVDKRSYLIFLRRAW